jgi:hypothetical protein
MNVMHERAVCPICGLYIDIEELDDDRDELKIFNTYLEFTCPQCDSTVEYQLRYLA